MQRLVEKFLRPFDDENMELVLRWRIWCAKWMPYRTAEFLGVGDDGDLLLGPWRWNPPDRFKRAA